SAESTPRQSGELLGDLVDSLHVGACVGDALECCPAFVRDHMISVPSRSQSSVDRTGTFPLSSCTKPRFATTVKRPTNPGWSRNFFSFSRPWPLRREPNREIRLRI